MEEESVAEWLASMLSRPRRDIGLKIESMPDSRYMRIIIGNKSYVRELRERFELFRPIIEAERGYPVTFEHLMYEALVHGALKLNEAVALLDIVGLAHTPEEKLVEMKGERELMIEKPLRERIGRCAEKLNAEPSVLIQNILESRLTEIESTSAEEIEAVRKLIKERGQSARERRLRC